MKKIMIILNAVKYNRGSEALVRGLVKICKSADANNQLYLVSSEPDFENTVYIEGIDKYINRYSYKSKYSPLGISSAVARKILKNSQLSASIRCRKMLKEAKGMDIVIVIGADNYDKSYKMFNMMHELNLILKKEVKGKRILYDCSLAKEDIDEAVIEDFKLFDNVTVRENITLSNFMDRLDEDILKYYPDPAFLMDPEKTELPKGFKEGQMIGINLSSLVLSEKYGSNQSKILEAYYQMIEYILDETDLDIVFIPHVMQGKDLKVLELLFEKYKATNRVVLIENESLKATELKYIISKCKFFMGARTHATIAAYSMCVPTLVMGYSVKSVGIASDLFGTHKNYVISTKNIKGGDELKNGLKWLFDNEIEIRNRLEEKIPEYKLLAGKMSELIK